MSSGSDDEEEDGAESRHQVQHANRERFLLLQPSQQPKLSQGKPASKA